MIPGTSTQTNKVLGNDKSFSAALAEFEPNKNIPEVARLIEAAGQLDIAFNNFYDAVESVRKSWVPLEPLKVLLQQLKNLRVAMSLLVTSQEVVENMSQDEQVIFARVRAKIDNFAIPLLAQDSILNTFINQIPLPLPLLNGIVNRASPKAVAAYLDGTGLEGIKGGFEKTDLNLIFIVMLEGLVSPGKTLPPPAFPTDKINDQMKLPVQIDAQVLKTIDIPVQNKNQQTPEACFDEIAKTILEQIKTYQPKYLVSSQYVRYSWSSDENIKMAKELENFVTYLKNDKTYYTPQEKLAMLRMRLKSDLEHVNVRHGKRITFGSLWQPTPTRVKAILENAQKIIAQKNQGNIIETMDIRDRAIMVNYPIVNREAKKMGKT